VETDVEGAAPARRGKPPRPAAARLGVEALETRLVPTVTVGLVNGQLQAIGDNAGNLVVVQHSGSNTVINGQSFADSAITNGILIQSGKGSDTVLIESTVKAITVQGQDGADKVTLGDGGKLAGIVAPVTVKNTASFTALTVDDANDTSSSSFSMNVGSDGVGTIFFGPSVGLISYNEADVSTVTVNAGAFGNTVDVQDTVGLFSFQSTVVNTGLGKDHVFVEGTTGALTINGQSGRDTVQVGNGFNKMADINGNVLVTNKGSFTDLVLSDGGDTSGHNVTMATSGANGTVSGLSFGTITYVQNDVSSVQVIGGGSSTSGNTFTVANTATNPYLSVYTYLFSGPGNDTVNVLANAGGLSIEGVSGQDTVNVGNAGSVSGVTGFGLSNQGGHTALNINDSATTTHRLVVVNDNSIIMGPVQIELFDPTRFSSITISGGNAGATGNTFFVHSTPAGVPVTLNTGDGNDQIIVANNGDTLDPIQGNLIINGQGGYDTLTINDNGSTTPHSYTQYGTTPNGTLYRTGAATISWTGIESYTLNPGPTPKRNPPPADSLAASMTADPAVADILFVMAAQGGGPLGHSGF
jgi:hypothetical protein